MLKKKIVGTIIILASIANSVPAKADQVIQEKAKDDAQRIILRQEKVDENQLQHCSSEYVNAFLVAYEAGTTSYENAYRQGIKDAHKKERHNYANVIAQAGYQRGLTCGEAAVAANKASTEGKKNEKHGKSEPPLLLDDKHSYEVKKPTINQAKFINRLAKSAQAIGQQYDLFPSVVIAQAALESNWGTSDLGRAPYFNLFGVKGLFAGKTVNKETSEYTNDGRKYQTQSNFRRYSSDLEALRDYAETLTNPLYLSVHRQYAKDYRAATKALVGKYATDPHYNLKLNQLIESYQLTKYDKLPQNSNSGAPKVFNFSTDAHSPTTERHLITTKKDIEKKKSPLYKSLPLVGGIGSAGLLEVIRRFILR